MFNHFVNLRDNETQDFIIYFDVMKDVLIYIWGVNPNEVHPSKLYKNLRFNPDVKKIVFTSQIEGDLFLQIFSIIFKNLGIGEINIIDNEIKDITINLEDLKSISSRYRLTLVNEDNYLRVKEVYKITKIS